MISLPSKKLKKADRFFQEFEFLLPAKLESRFRQDFTNAGFNKHNILLTVTPMEDTDLFVELKAPKKKQTLYSNDQFDFLEFLDNFEETIAYPVKNITSDIMLNLAIIADR